MVFFKQTLFMLMLISVKMFISPKEPTPMTTIVSDEDPGYKYSPSICNVTNYDFTFIYDEDEKAFKVHGLWPEQCAECLTCGYPYCCATSNMSYVYPSDPSQVAFLNARWFNATTREECFNKGGNNMSEASEVPLFEHEFYKHASCTPMRPSASQFVEQVMRLYDEHYKTRVENQCPGYNQLWLNLDGNFEYNNVTKCL